MTPAETTRRRRPLLIGAAAGITAAAAVAAGLTFSWYNQEKVLADPCPAPTAVELVDLSARTEAVVRGTIDKLADLSDGTTFGGGWVVRVEQQIAGVSPGVTANNQTIAIWPRGGDGAPKAGEHVVLWLNKHPDKTTFDGTNAPAFDPREVLIETDGAVARLCKDSRSEPVDSAVVG